MGLKIVDTPTDGKKINKDPYQPFGRIIKYGANAEEAIREDFILLIGFCVIVLALFLVNSW